MSVLAVSPVVTDDLQRRRVTVFFRLFMALPHLFMLGMLVFIGALLAPITWLIVLIRGSLPESLHDFYATMVRYSVHTYAYLYLGAEPWPSVFAARGYPIDVTVAPPAEHQNRWGVAFRLILALPALFLAGALGAGAATLSRVSIYSSLGVLPTVAFLGWFACLARSRMPAGMRDLLVYGLSYGAQTYAYLLFLTPRYPDSDPGRLGVATLPPHPIRLDLSDPELRRDRLLVFFRGLLALPHFVWLVLWSIVALFAVIAAWFAALATGRVPDALHRFLAARLRYQTHVYGFLYLVADPFPGFTGAPGSYPVVLEIGAPERHSRWTVLFRLVLAFPAMILAGGLSSVQTIAAIMGWFASLFTGRMPHGLRNLHAYVLRYSAQLGAYLALLTPVYPFSGPGPCDR
ncbi:MAG: hypothetical protein QOD53_1522 [Thermoleophilaceae bacterium]|jgi:hypothetical protein|nr:hypothetical protein [Thermoleophilaceae bacterium]